MIKVLIKENDHIISPSSNQASWTSKDLSEINNLNHLNITELEKVDLALTILWNLKMAKMSSCKNGLNIFSCRVYQICK